MSSNGLSPEEIEILINDDKNFKVWVIQQLVALNKKIDKVEGRYNTLIQVMSALLGFVVTVIVILVQHLLK